MFELRQQNAKIAHVNLREEKRGEEDVLACDLKIEAKMGNDFLAQLHPALRSSLYDRGDELDLGDNHLSKLRYPKLLLPLKWDGKIVGGKVTIHAPISDDDLTVFSDVSELRLSPQDGGTVIVAFRAQFRPDEDQAARLPFLLGKLVEISVEKPVAAAQDDLASDAADGDQDGGDDDDDDAGDETLLTFPGRSADATDSTDETEQAGPSETRAEGDAAGEPLHEIRPYEDGFLIYLGDTPTAGAQKFKTHEDAEAYLQKHLGVGQKAGRFERTEPPVETKRKRKTADAPAGDSAGK